ncbi:hypothetical protein K504DRAFT_452011 [Pleomassaria siparia CBS 279.74]|uniref:Methyltransferase domain-containing protein n=1 Tax=Pleomassaria siparia CBS 279.74 TaxID=1314801 RepID=A0A6G1JRV7_9PLEO|nr:hypothetical protein K504DRAFT_452011 [Pleomassaria siparia CBS 279.74]
MDILDLLMREDLSQFVKHDEEDEDFSWRGHPPPPDNLLQYIKQVRRHLLGRTFPPPNSGLSSQKSTIARRVALGMKIKKVHEVDNFSRYVDRLTAEIATSGKKEITHLVDFGSGQNYLGRALAAEPYSKHIVAVESKQHNIEGAKSMDVLARLVPKPLVMRNKKEHRAAEQKKPKKGINCDANYNIPTPIEEPPVPEDAQEPECGSNGCKPQPTTERPVADPAKEAIENRVPPSNGNAVTTTLQIYTEGQGSVQYVEHVIKGGDLAPVIEQILDSSQVQETTTSKAVEEPADISAVPKIFQPNVMVISLHSCGNLVHHGLRSLLINPSVSAVAMVGCCYNLLTERLGPPTYKLPSLRPNHPRLESTSNAFDPNGFPMSERLATYPLPYPPDTSGHDTTDSGELPKGIRMNITARMMAVQAPYNWGAEDSDLFFTRHYYRALLQRIFLDRGVVSVPEESNLAGGAVSAAGHTSKVNWTPQYGRGPGLSSNGTATPLTIGTLRKFAYKDFTSYVRAAIAKLTTPNTFCEVDPEFIASKMGGLTDDDIKDYEMRFSEKKKELNIMWSLMAFSAGVVESVIVTDRWLWLKEQPEVEAAWVEPVFEYAQSPRNLVVVGIKK